ncbi:C_GCAxxG_C_C family protein [Olavius algarvensis associated proteobacterium Delta 3]|nr:C_GCAxxG_C_C family protein [Olavius algarvensis associated proteobacterium Delta 3]CAB5151344.1 C_GCAxxG_C_C family protein [Olavius algarvensis associated proteobacterium Delta 3]
MKTEEKHPSPAEALIAQIRERALNLYETRQLLCAEAVMVALNQGLNGGLTEDQAISMAAPFSEAMGDSGCMCGAVSGAVLGSGLLLGKDHPYRHRKEMRDNSRELHDAFKAAHGSTCCRALSRNFRHDKKAHHRHCAEFTGNAAELAARLVLEKRPELLQRADTEFLAERQSKFKGALSRVFRLLSN